MPGASQVPGAIRRQVEDAFHRNGIRNLAMLAHLRAVADAASSRGCRLLVLKGAHLAGAVYQSIAHRVLADIDILVPDSDTGRVREALLELGMSQEARPGLPDDRPDLHHHLAPFVTSSPFPIAVEVHRALVRPGLPFTIDMEQLWSRARPTEIHGAEVLGLSPEDLLLHLSVHSTYCHQLAHGLRGLCDIHQVVTRYAAELDWDQLVQRALEWRAARCTGLSLDLARHLLGTSAPEDVIRRLAGCSASELQRARDMAITAVLTERAPLRSRRLREPTAGSRIAPLLERAAELLQALVPPPKRLRAAYPDLPRPWLIGLCYPHQWLTLLRRHVVPRLRAALGNARLRSSAQAEGSFQTLLAWMRSGKPSIDKFREII